MFERVKIAACAASTRVPWKVPGSWRQGHPGLQEELDYPSLARRFLAAEPSREATYRRPASGASRSFSSTCRRHRQLRMPLSTLPAPSTAIRPSLALPDVSQHPQLNSRHSATPSPFPRLVSPRSSPSPASPRPSQALRQRIAVRQAAESGSTSLRMSRAFATPSARAHT